MDTFLQQDGECLLTANVVLDVLHNVFGIRVLPNRFAERFWCG
jgi:hypothetical protein